MATVKKEKATGTVNTHGLKADTLPPHKAR